MKNKNKRRISILVTAQTAYNLRLQTSLSPNLESSLRTRNSGQSI